MAKMGFNELLLRRKLGNVKKTTDKWFSLYIRFRGALEFQKEVPDADIFFGRCCTCGKVGQWKYMDCGHFISKGRGGASGVRWDERNAHLQCKGCNAFSQGNAQEYMDFMLKKYGQGVIDELRIKDKINSYKGQLWAIGQFYKEQYKKLQKKL